MSKVVLFEFLNVLQRLSNNKLSLSLIIVTENLVLYNNDFDGNMPTLNSTSLQYLDLSNNTLTGHIPSSLFSFPKLQYVYLSNNYLSGSVPSWDKVTPIKDIFLNGNHLNGTIPDITYPFTSLPNLGEYFIFSLVLV